MNIEEYKKILKDNRYEIIDYKHPNMPFTRWNHIIRDKKKGYLWLTIKVGDDEVAFIDMHQGDRKKED